MTDPEFADRTYIEPLTREYLEEIVRVERELSPGAGFAILPTVGGQTALNLAIELSDSGVLEKFNVKLIGANVEAIKKAEDRLYFKDAMQKIGLDIPKSQLVNDLKSGLEFAGKIGYPVIVRPSFTLGGSGGGMAYNREELLEVLARGLDFSPVHEALIEDSIRRPSAHRTHGGDRNEPARLALVSTGVESHWISDCENSGQARRRLHARRNPQRHHPQNSGLL